MPVLRVRGPDRARSSTRSQTLQSPVERYYSDVSERTTDTLGNIALVQSFTRVESEVHGMKKLGDQCSARRSRCCRGGRWRRCITRTATTLTILAILIARHLVLSARQTTVGEIVMFMSYRHAC